MALHVSRAVCEAERPGLAGMLKSTRPVRAPVPISTCACYVIRFCVEGRNDSSAADARMPRALRQDLSAGYQCIKPDQVSDTVKVLVAALERMLPQLATHNISVGGSTPVEIEHQDQSFFSRRWRPRKGICTECSHTVH